MQHIVDSDKCYGKNRRELRVGLPYVITYLDGYKITERVECDINIHIDIHMRMWCVCSEAGVCFIV